MKARHKGIELNDFSSEEGIRKSMESFLDNDFQEEKKRNLPPQQPRTQPMPSPNMILE
jgi:hypothetical protein